MFARTMRVAGILALLCGVAEAQDGLRSAALPEPTLSSPVANEHDLFRVPADFYSRPPDANASRLFLPDPLPAFVWGPYWPVTQVPQHRARPDIEAVEPQRRDRDVTREANPSPTVMVPRMAPGKPKIFYVIPGCYAGDRPPRLEWLPAGCDRTNIRMVPPLK